MAGKAEQNDKGNQLAQVIGDKPKGRSNDELISQNERLNLELREAIDARDNAIKAQETAVELAKNDVLGDLAAKLVSRRLATQAEVDSADFDPVGFLFAQLDAAIAECNSAKRSLKAQKGATTKVKGAIEALQESLKPRPLGPIDDQLAPAELVELFNATDRVELAFSDGRSELAGVPPISVPGAAFTFRRGRLMLETGELIVRGPADERGTRVLAGYAALVDGEQVAWIPRLAGELPMGAGIQYSILGDVVLT